MNSDHLCSSRCAGICHMNAAAQAMYVGLLVDGQGDLAESLRTGVSA